MTVVLARTLHHQQLLIKHDAEMSQTAVRCHQYQTRTNSDFEMLSVDFPGPSPAFIVNLGMRILNVNCTVSMIIRIIREPPPAIIASTLIEVAMLRTHLPCSMHIRRDELRQHRSSGHGTEPESHDLNLRCASKLRFNYQERPVSACFSQIRKELLATDVKPISPVILALWLRRDPDPETKKT